MRSSRSCGGAAFSGRAAPAALRRRGLISEVRQVGAQGIAADAEQRRRLQLIAVAGVECVAHQRVQHPLVKLAAVALQLLPYKVADGVVAGAGRFLQALVEPQLVGGDQRILAQQHRVVQRVFQLAHVARPAVIQQRLQRLRRQLQPWPPEAARVQR